MDAHARKKRRDVKRSVRKPLYFVACLKLPLSRSRLSLTIGELEISAESRDKFYIQRQVRRITPNSFNSRPGVERIGPYVSHKQAHRACRVLSKRLDSAISFILTRYPKSVLDIFSSLEYAIKACKGRSDCVIVKYASGKDVQEIPSALF